MDLVILNFHIALRVPDAFIWIAFTPRKFRNAYYAFNEITPVQLDTLELIRVPCVWFCSYIV